MRSSSSNPNTDQFLLLFGMARSGTSWIGKIFDSHPLTLYKHEPDRIMPGVPMAPRLDQAQQLRAAILSFLTALPMDNATHSAGRLPVFPKGYRSHLIQKLHHSSVLASGAFSSMGWRLPVLQFARPTPDVRIVWKSIDSLARLGVILKCADGARAIRITRHPCASIASTLRGEARRKFASSVPASEDYGMIKILLSAATRDRGLTIDHLKTLRAIERLAWIWIITNEKAVDDTRGSKRCMHIRYEDVCRNPMHEVKKLFAFSGLDWCDQTTQFIEASTLGVQPSKLDRLTQDSRRYYSIFKNPLESAEKWKSELKDKDIDSVYKVLQQSDLIELYPESESAICLSM